MLMIGISSQKIRFFVMCLIRSISMSTPVVSPVFRLLCYNVVSSYMWFKVKGRRRPRRRRTSSITKHYLAHKEPARALILFRLETLNKHYGFVYRRVAIRNTRRSWGSCSSLKNLNFSYKILFLPSYLQDYILTHELCHLSEMNHGSNFWSLVAETIPDYEACIHDLRSHEKTRDRARGLS